MSPNVAEDSHIFGLAIFQYLFASLLFDSLLQLCLQGNLLVQSEASLNLGQFLLLCRLLLVVGIVAYATARSTVELRDRADRLELVFLSGIGNLVRAVLT